MIRSIRSGCHTEPARSTLRSDDPGPELCPLCGVSRRTHSARFRQLYTQANGPAFPLKWFECRACAGWFAYPVPPPEIIQRNWDGVAYSDPHYEVAIAGGKALVHQRLLDGLSRRISPGPLLDFGSNFGQFLRVAAAAGWTPYGFDPCARAVEAARAKGFHVRRGWSLQDAGFPDTSFSAITAIDVFSYVWHPIATVDTFYHLLR